MLTVFRKTFGKDSRITTPLGPFAVSRWNDNCPVMIASHYFTVTPISKTERQVKNEHRRAVEQPHPVKMYNHGMGGVDVCNHMLSSY